MKVSIAMIAASQTFPICERKQKGPDLRSLRMGLRRSGEAVEAIKGPWQLSHTCRKTYVYVCLCINKQTILVGGLVAIFGIGKRGKRHLF